MATINKRYMIACLLLFGADISRINIKEIMIEKTKKIKKIKGKILFSGKKDEI